MTTKPETYYESDAYRNRASRMRFGKMMLFAGSRTRELGQELAELIAEKDG